MKVHLPAHYDWAFGICIRENESFVGVRLLILIMVAYVYRCLIGLAHVNNGGICLPLFDWLDACSSVTPTCGASMKLLSSSLFRPLSSPLSHITVTDTRTPFPHRSAPLQLPSCPGSGFASATATSLMPFTLAFIWPSFFLQVQDVPDFLKGAAAQKTQHIEVKSRRMATLKKSGVLSRQSTSAIYALRYSRNRRVCISICICWGHFTNRNPPITIYTSCSWCCFSHSARDAPQPRVCRCPLHALPSPHHGPGLPPGYPWSSNAAYHSNS